MITRIWCFSSCFHVLCHQSILQQEVETRKHVLTSLCYRKTKAHDQGRSLGFGVWLVVFKFYSPSTLHNKRWSAHTVDPTPLRTPTMVVVRAELTMVHKNMVKLRTMPITNERTRITKKYNELLCKRGHGSLLDQLKRNLRFARTLLLINYPWEISQYIYKHIQ